MLAWVKTFHIVFMVAWFAGLFYLPRLFVYHTEIAPEDRVNYQRFCTMERRLSILMSIGAVLTILFGGWLMALYGGAWIAANAWLHVKLLLVLGLIGFHGWCQIQVKHFRQQRNTHGANLFRKMNEVPTVFLLLIVILVEVQPF